jgi:bifunctional non-homologous end joining protein LigD
MGLKQYQAKRQKPTSEPKGKVATSRRGQLRFVVQKHAASHLHYDFRLELDGVLLSWAVPKGPSMKPAEKRLAIHVEDHPFDYRNFEGTIPKGSYGGGTVMIWDEGTYIVPEAKDRKESEALVRAGMKRGKLELVLEGEKLKGGFHLIKIAKNWLLMKRKDEHASTRDISKKDRSVRTDRTMTQIERARK